MPPSTPLNRQTANMQEGAGALGIVAELRREQGIDLLIATIECNIICDYYNSNQQPMVPINVDDYHRGIHE
jgi:hypothetical protein